MAKLALNGGEPVVKSGLGKEAGPSSMKPKRAHF